MSPLAPLLQSFFTERLINQSRVSAHTVASYRDSFRLLLGFAQARTGKSPSRLDLVDLDAHLVGDFLDYLEHERHNSVRTRNSRLVAVHSFFRFASLHEPDHAALIQRVLAIPQKRFERAIVSFLTHEEIAAILAEPDLTTWIGRRDHALLVVAIHTGLRVSELTGLRCQDAVLTTGAHLFCRGKGRKNRCTPLTPQAVKILRAWTTELSGGADSPLFPSRRGEPLSTDAVERLLNKYAHTAEHQCPSLRAKRVTPHVLRHSTAMGLLANGANSVEIALILGHESLQSSQIYVHADMTIKQRALDRMTPPQTATGRYRPSDRLLAFLDGL
jgi:integrase/recombinase XerD